MLLFWKSFYFLFFKLITLLKFQIIVGSQKTAGVWICNAKQKSDRSPNMLFSTIKLYGLIITSQKSVVVDDLSYWNWDHGY